MGAPASNQQQYAPEVAELQGRLASLRARISCAVHDPSIEQGAPSLQALIAELQDLRAGAEAIAASASFASASSYSVPTSRASGRIQEHPNFFRNSAHRRLASSGPCTFDALSADCGDAGVGFAGPTVGSAPVGSAATFGRYVDVPQHAAGHALTSSFPRRLPQFPHAANIPVRVCPHVAAEPSAGCSEFFFSNHASLAHSSNVGCSSGLSQSGCGCCGARHDRVAFGGDGVGAFATPSRSSSAAARPLLEHLEGPPAGVTPTLLANMSFGPAQEPICGLGSPPASENSASPTSGLCSSAPYTPPFLWNASQATFPAPGFGTGVGAPVPLPEDRAPQRAMERPLRTKLRDFGTR